MFCFAEYLQRWDESIDSEGVGNSSAALSEEHETHSAAYDPAFLLPFTLEVSLSLQHTV